MIEEMPGIPQEAPGEHHAEVIPTDIQPQVDENGYLPDGTKRSYVQDQDIDLAHEAANASNEDRSVAALHREQGDTYRVDRGNNIYRDRHYDVARAIDTLSDQKEDSILGSAVEIGNPDNSEKIDDHEREHIDRLVELRAGAAKIHSALSGSVENITQILREIAPPNAYADTLRRRLGSVNLENQSKYDEAFLDEAKYLAYAQKFGVISDKYDAKKNGVEFTAGWPEKYNRWRSSLEKTVELNAMSLLSKSSDEEGKVTFAVDDSVKETGVSEQSVDELSKLAERLSYHTNTYYARIESAPSIVIGQDKNGSVIAKAYFFVQVGDRYSKDLEVVDLSDVDSILKLAGERLQPFTDEVNEGQRRANLVEPDVIKENAYEQAEARNQQFIEEFKVSAPEFNDIPDAELHELLRIAATGDTSADLTRKDELTIDAIERGGKLSIVTDNDGNIVDDQSIRSSGDMQNGDFESWKISGVDKVSKTTYKGSPWSMAFGRKVQGETEVNMSADEIVALRKRILDIQLRQSAA